MAERWIKVEVYGQLREGETLKFDELPASLGFERIVLVTAIPLEPLPVVSEETDA